MLSQQSLLVKPVDETGVDLAARWGHEDATEGNRRGGDMFTLLSPEYHSYHAAYGVGLAVMRQLTGSTLSSAELAECAWFDEISEGKLPVVFLTREQLVAIEAERPGHEICSNPEVW